MFHYVALVWDKSDPKQVEASDVLTKALRASDGSFHTAFDHNGVRILCSDVDPRAFAVHLLPNNSGALLGFAFKRHSDLKDESPDTLAEFDIPATHELIASKGRALISKYWGDYVALLIEPHSHSNQGRAVHVIKDPTGRLPCYVTSFRNVEVLFSCLSDCVGTGLMNFTVNRDYLACSVSGAGYQFAAWARAPMRPVDPLNEVTRIIGGECITISVGGGQRRSRQFYWTPIRCARPELVIDNESEATQALHATLRSAIGTLSRRHESVLMRCSGGLDSSIVSGCLQETKQPGVRVRSYMYYVPGGKSDERYWARLAAEHSGYDLMEVPLEPWNTRLDDPANMQPTVAPVWSALAFRVRNPIELKLFELEPYTAVFNGDGGDFILGRKSVPHAVDDFLRLKGISKGLITVGSRVALRTGTLTWSVLGSAIWRRMRGSAMKDDYEKQITRPALAAEPFKGVGASLTRHPHPWFSASDEVPWDIIHRVGNLVAPPEIYNPFAEPGELAPYIAQPFYSQPMVELCLRIPAYIHFYEGRDRGLARAAFKREIPEQIRRRQWKDQVPGGMETLVDLNRTYLRDTLLGGVLCKEGFLDPAAVQNALSGRFSTAKFYVDELINYLHLECWLRNFASSKALAMVA
jgi:asparagine synthase (glutamine-hydrolysing)